MRAWHATLVDVGSPTQVEVGECLAGYRTGEALAAVVADRAAFRLVGASGEQREAVHLALTALLDKSPLP